MTDPVFVAATEEPVHFGYWVLHIPFVSLHIDYFARAMASVCKLLWWNVVLFPNAEEVRS